MANNNWGYGPKTFEVANGVDQIIRLDVPYRGSILGINLQQADGTAGGTFEIYDSQRVVPEYDSDAASSYSISSEDAVDFTPDAYSITAGEVTITSGVYIANDINIPYVNRDGNLSNGVRHLWLRMNITGGGTSKWYLSMIIEPVSLSG